MYQKIKTGLLLLCCSIALSACADRVVVAPINLDIPVEDVGVDPFPAPPSGPQKCMAADGSPVLCQREVAIWVETEVKPAYDQCVATVTFLKRSITHDLSTIADR